MLCCAVCCREPFQRKCAFDVGDYGEHIVSATVKHCWAHMYQMRHCIGNDCTVRQCFRPGHHGDREGTVPLPVTASVCIYLKWRGSCCPAAACFYLVTME
jgi:hypothetical protein